MKKGVEMKASKVYVLPTSVMKSRDLLANKPNLMIGQMM